MEVDNPPTAHIAAAAAITPMDVAAEEAMPHVSLPNGVESHENGGQEQVKPITVTATTTTTTATTTSTANSTSHAVATAPLVAAGSEALTTTAQEPAQVAPPEVDVLLQAMYDALPEEEKVGRFWG